MTEYWKPVVGWPAYIVSNFGNVRRVVKSKGVKTGILHPRPAANGYLRVSLCQDGKTVYKNVHTLVCEAFHGQKPSPKHEVAHADGCRTNPHADNLRWVTQSENTLDACMHGRRARKLIREQVEQIIASSEEISNLANKFCVNKSTINRIRSGYTWRWLRQSPL